MAQLIEPLNRDVEIYGLVLRQITRSMPQSIERVTRDVEILSWSHQVSGRQIKSVFSNTEVVGVRSFLRIPTQRALGQHRPLCLKCCQR